MYVCDGQTRLDVALPSVNNTFHLRHYWYRLALIKPYPAYNATRVHTPAPPSSPIVITTLAHHSDTMDNSTRLTASNYAQTPASGLNINNNNNNNNDNNIIRTESDYDITAWQKMVSATSGSLITSLLGASCVLLCAQSQVSH